jgi:hypothetical protein
VGGPVRGRHPNRVGGAVGAGDKACARVNAARSKRDDGG